MESSINSTVAYPSAALLQARTFAEFFAGIGLMRMGLEKAGWAVEYANDIDEDKFSMYAAQFRDASSHFRLADIHTLEQADIPSVTMATASFPCTDLSLAGAREGLAGRHSSAYWGFVRLLEDMGKRRPPLVLLENVVGFLTSHGGSDFENAMLALSRLGYKVDALVLDAERFVPQSRVRLFVIGVLDENRETSMVHECPSFYQSAVRPRALADFIFDHPNISWGIRDVATPPVRQLSLRDVIEDLPDDSDYWWNAKRTEYLANQMSPKHSSELSGMMRKRKWSYGTVFRRVRNGKSMAELRTDGIAGCLRTPKGGSGRQILVKAGYGKMRARLLIPEECARLMGADGFRISAPLNQALFGFGDAVCVPAVTWLAENYLNPLIDEMADAGYLPMAVGFDNGKQV